VFEDRVQRALVKLGVPGRDDLNALTHRVERLTEELRKANGGAPKQAAKAPRKTAAKAPARKSAKPAAKAPAKRASARKAATPAASAD
ncbi:MAG TPA: phasin family protein, partial [Thermomonas sp.]|nr:phasin family protein [Thermomonas sp.]